jgi:DNA-binding CsgD family transcriptional regulator
MKIETAADALNLVKNEWYRLKKVPESLRTLEVCRAAVENDSRALKYVPEYLLFPGKDADQVFLDALAENPRVFRSLANDVREDPALSYIAVDADPENLRYCPVQTMPLCGAAVRGDGLMLRYIKEPSYGIYEQAVEQNGLALKYVDGEWQTEDLCEAAVAQNPLAVIYVRHKNEAMQRMMEENDSIVSGFYGVEATVINQVTKTRKGEYLILEEKLLKKTPDEKQCYMDCNINLKSPYIWRWTLSDGKFARYLSNLHEGEYRYVAFSRPVFNAEYNKATITVLSKYPGGRGDEETITLEKAKRAWVITESVRKWTTYKERKNAKSARNRQRILEKTCASSATFIMVGRPSFLRDMIRRYLINAGWKLIGETYKMEDGGALLRTLEEQPLLSIAFDERDPGEAWNFFDDELCHHVTPQTLGLMIVSDYNDVTRMQMFRDASNSAKVPIAFLGQYSTTNDIDNALSAMAKLSSYFPYSGQITWAEMLFKEKEITENESQVFGCVQFGWDNARIASVLGMKVHSVENIVSRLLKKLECKDRKALMEM